MKWLHRSACLKEDPELFFPIGEAGPARGQMEDAKRVCMRCEVREQCLAWALESGQDHGVLGGMTETERRALRRSNLTGRSGELDGNHRAGLLQPGAEVEAGKVPSAAR